MKTKDRSNPAPASGRAAGFGDVPASRPAELDSFDVLVGRWDMEASFEAGKFGPGTPAMTSRSATTIFEWLEGKFFLLQRFTSEHPAAPNGIAIIGPGAEPGTMEQHYYDSRGVARIYRTTVEGRTWKVWRGEAGSWQRYIGVISEDGTQIVGAWEGSTNGREWTRDFGLTYMKSRG